MKGDSQQLINIFIAIGLEMNYEQSIKQIISDAMPKGNPYLEVYIIMKALPNPFKYIQRFEIVL